LLPPTGNSVAIRPESIDGNTISGIRGSALSFLLDGVDVSEQHQGGTFIQTSIDALQEFSVEQNPYSAEFNRGGGFFNATTKSGTNQFHGDLFEFLRNDELDARNFFAIEREPLKRNQFGGTLGGPLSIPHVYSGKDRTFFFGSYEGQRLRQGIVENSVVPSAAETSAPPTSTGFTTRSPQPAAPLPRAPRLPATSFPRTGFRPRPCTSTNTFLCLTPTPAPTPTILRRPSTSTSSRCALTIRSTARIAFSHAGALTTIAKTIPILLRSWATRRSTLRAKISPSVSPATSVRTRYRSSALATSFKSFPITEGSRLEFRAEFFNLPNVTSFNPPSLAANSTAAPAAAVDTSTGGKILSTSTNPRQIQFSLKLYF
jgi:hypothetical protein